MQKITPHLWFDKEAREASEFYTQLFPNSKVTDITTLHDTPSGDCDVVSFELWGHEFMSISAGPLFTFNPSVSFMVNFGPPHIEEKDEAKAQLERVWERLSDGGTPLMPLDKYPFSERYGWIQDKYGLSWQLILTTAEGGDPRPPIMPFLMFVGDKVGKAEEAINFYLSVFRNAKQGIVVRYPAGMEPEQEGNIMFADFMLEAQWFAALESGREHKFDFNEAVSLMVNCKDQAEVDAYWEKLSAVPESEQCGWCKDKFGVSWQVVPAALGEMMKNGTREQVDRVTQAFLPMKKFEIAKLREAYEGDMIQNSSTQSKSA